MLGKPSKRARRRLEESGRHAPAQILEVAERGMAITSGPEGLVSSTEVLLKTTLRVEPPGEPAFEVTKRIRYPQLATPVAGMRVTVLYDPDDHDELIIDHTAPAAPAAVGGGGTGGVQDLGAILGVVQAAQQDAHGDPQALAAALRERFGSGAVISGPEVVSFGGASAPDDRLDQLEQLGRLRASGVLTDDEFAAEKAKLLAGP